jgi:hypothetical protein
MSSRSPTGRRQAFPADRDREALLNEGPQSSGAQPLLLLPDPAALIRTDLVEQPVDLPQEQFATLLIDSECEV